MFPLAGKVLTSAEKRSLAIDYESEMDRQRDGSSRHLRPIAVCAGSDGVSANGAGGTARP